ncbi:MAG: hypothetical protein ACJ72D_06865 [Marmoricola sp.]
MTSGRDLFSARRSGTVRTAVLGWVPALVVVAAFVVVLRRVDVPVTTSLQFVALQVVVFTVPGCIFWRALVGRHPLVVDATFGTIGMHALVVPWYLLVRHLGVPHLVWVLSAASLIVVVRAALRRDRERPDPVDAPWWMAWHLGAAVTAALFLLRNDIPNVLADSRRWPGTDAPYALSLAAELKHHAPPVVPFVTGQPLDYHWFSFADFAAVSWLGGQELDVLTFVLMPTLLVVVGFLAFSCLGWQLGGTPWAGVVAVWIAVLVGSANVVGWFDNGVVDSTLLVISWFASPTQAFAQVLELGVLALLLDLVRAPASRALPRFLALVVMTTVMAGSKATFIPVLGAGVALALVVGWRQVPLRRWLLALGVALVAELVFAQVVLFGGASQGLSLTLTGSVEHLAGQFGILAPGDGGLLVVAAVLVLGWVLPLVIGLAALTRPGSAGGLRDDVFSWLLAGMVLAGMGAAVLLSQPGFSQLFFLRAGLPLGALLVATVLARGWSTYDARVRRTVLLAVASGLALCLVLRHVSDDVRVPTGAVALAKLVACALAVLAVIAVLAALTAPAGARLATTLLVVGAVGLGMGAVRTTDLARGPLAHPASAAVAGVPAAIPAGGIAAARYVRDHSSEDDLVATNAHCRLPHVRPCDNRGHWISAWAERRTLVQGWGYTARANSAGNTLYAVVYDNRFWDPALLELNDALFTDPSPQTLDALTQRYDVRWLVVDDRYPVDLPGLEELLPDFEQFGRTTVFRVGGR